MKRWYVRCWADCFDKAMMPLPQERVWTVTRDPKEPGWETDAGYEGHGLTFAEATELANAANEKATTKKIK